MDVILNDNLQTANYDLYHKTKQPTATPSSALMVAFETQTSCRPGPINTSCALESIQYFRIGHLNKVFLLTLINFNLI
jgi:hypothetical protein